MLTAAQNQLQRTTAEQQGIASAAILGFIEAVEQQIHDLHSFILVRHGNVVAEGWWSPYASDRPHMLFSLSKSFTSSAIGLAVMEGRLSVDDTVLSFFPDETPAQVDANLAAMKVHHLLSMSTGHAEDTLLPLREAQGKTWVETFLALPVTYEPGTHFLYNTGASYMLSAIIQKVTGERLLDYLRPRLLEPLGIEDAEWEVSPEGINTGGYGLSIKTDDIAKFGQMYLAKRSLERQSNFERKLGRDGNLAPNQQRQQPEQRLGARLRLSVLALSPQRLSRRWRFRSILHRDARPRCGAGDHERLVGYASGAELSLGSSASGDG